MTICEGPQVDDGTAWEVGYAYGRNIPVYGLRTDARIAQQPDERINLMILESLNELSPSIPQLLHTLRYAEIPRREFERQAGQRMDEGHEGSLRPRI